MTAMRVPHSGSRPPAGAPIPGKEAPMGEHEPGEGQFDEAPTVEFAEGLYETGPGWVPPSWPQRPPPEPKAKIERKSARAVAEARSGATLPRSVRVGAFSLVALAVIGVGVATMTGREEPSTSPPSSTAIAAQANPTGSCEAKSDGPVIQGDGAGGTDSGSAAIFGFQHAYYVARSGAAARAFVAPEVPDFAADSLQAGIDNKVPVGTTHCVTVVAVGDGRFAVTVTELQPAGVRKVHNQFVTTRTDETGHVWITGISKA